MLCRINKHYNQNPIYCLLVNKLVWKPTECNILLYDATQRFKMFHAQIFLLISMGSNPTVMNIFAQCCKMLDNKAAWTLDTKCRKRTEKAVLFHCVANRNVSQQLGTKYCTRCVSRFNVTGHWDTRIGKRKNLSA